MRITVGCDKHYGVKRRSLSISLGPHDKSAASTKITKSRATLFGTIKPPVSRRFCLRRQVQMREHVDRHIVVAEKISGSGLMAW